MNNEKFLKLFFICFYIFLKIFCLAPFSINFKTFKSKFSSFTAFSYIIVVTLFLIFDEFLEGKIYEGHDNNFLSKLIEIFNLLLTFKSYILISVSVLLFIFKNNQRKKAYNEIKEVISFLNWNTLTFQLRKSAFKFFKIQILFVIYFIGIRFVYYLIRNENPKLMILLFYLPLSQYRYFIIIVLVAQQHFIFIFFNCCFKALNVYLKVQINICKNQTELIDLVDKTAKSHFRLLEIAFSLNRTYSVILLMLVFDKFVNLVVQSFIVYVRSMLYYRNNIQGDILSNFILEVIMLGSYGIVRIVQIVVILYAGWATIKEVSLIKFSWPI